MNNISTTTIDPIIQNFEDARKGVQYIGQPILFTMGMIGSILNIIIFMSPSMRSNSCAIYLHASSWANIFCLTWGVLASMLATFTNNNPIYYNMFYCKLRFFMIDTFQLASRVFIVLATIDRYFLCSISLQKRQFCRATVAIRIVILTFFISASATTYILVLYEANPIKKQCILDSLIVVQTILFWIIPFGTPTMLMSIFGGLIIWKLKQNARRANRDQVRVHARDRHLITMLIGQVLLYVMTSLPHACNLLYIAITRNVLQKPLQRLVIENFFTTLFNSFGYYLFNGLTFYVYILTAPTFRRELLRILWRRQWLAQRQIQLNHNRISPDMPLNIINS